MAPKQILVSLLFLPALLTTLIIQTGCKKNDASPALPDVPASVTDIDGNIYHTVKLGTQGWLAENLKTIHYRNGDAVPDVTDSAQWGSITSGAYCNYNNIPGNAGIYGRLYNWSAVSDSRNICPAGWHIPTEAEWQTLMDFLGGEPIAGGKLKDTGTLHWMAPNTGATNSSGFTALPAGYRNDQGVFANVSGSTIFWSSTQHDATHAWYRYLYYNYNGMYKDYYHDKTHGFSLRCIMDK